jgi:hypothetical protein
MNTQAQLRTELYSALYDNVTLPNEIYWIGKPTLTSAFPCIIYTILDTTGGYAFQDGLVSEDFTVQLDVYVDLGDQTNMDIIVQKLKDVMFAIGYRNIGQPVEFIESDINKIMRVTRWEKINV